MYGQMCGSNMSDAAKRKAKQKRAVEKPKLDYARQLRGIFFIEPDDEEFKHTMIKKARRKLEIPMPEATLCKTSVNCRGETCRSIGKSKTKYACIVDADETMRIRLEEVPQMWSAWGRPGSQTPRRSCGSALDPRYRIGNSSARKVQTGTRCRSVPCGNSKDGGWNMRMEWAWWRDMTCALQTSWSMRVRVCTSRKEKVQRKGACDTECVCTSPSHTQ